jgi:hypothetical protein
LVALVPEARLEIVTVAPSTTAPDPSVTVPDNAVVFVWANREREPGRLNIMRKRKALQHRMRRICMYVLREEKEV